MTLPNKIRFNAPNVRDQDALLRALNHRAVVLDLDQAQLVKAPRGEPSPAAAWLSRWSVMADGLLSANQVEWTPFGVATIEREPRYTHVQPNWVQNAAGNVLAMHSASLVGLPMSDTSSIALNAADGYSIHLGTCSALAWGARALSKVELAICRAMGLTAEQFLAVNADEAQLTPVQLRVCRAMGLTPAEFLATPSAER
jgi:hypothetical protein